MDEDFKEVSDENSENIGETKICIECEGEFEGEGDKCPDCEDEEVLDLE